MNSQHQETAVPRSGKNKIKLKHIEAEKRVNVLVNGQLFTSYQYPSNVAKPILYPILTRSGKMLTRGYPIDPMPGERVDHPHHVGHWLNYGNVNGLDFWNNSEGVAEEKKHKYGSIYHQEITAMSQKDGQATLEVTAVWKAPAGQELLDEKTTFIFSANGNTRMIERITQLTAKEEDVSFKDNKEGMLAVRVARALEFPTKKPILLLDAKGERAKEKSMDNTGVSGNYLSSEGLEGRKVWGTRAKWMKLYGEMEGEPVAIAILDHPDNPGYPTYWHARDYGLFSANPLGQAVFSKGKEELNLVLKAGTSVTFKYQILVHSGSPLSKEKIEAAASAFAK